MEAAPQPHGELASPTRYRSLSGTSRILDNGLRVHHYAPAGTTRGLVVMAPGSAGGMGPGQTTNHPERYLFSPEIESIYTATAKQLASANFAVCALTWRTPPTRAGASPARRKMEAALRDGAHDVATAARFLRVAHEGHCGAATLPMVLVGYCFGVPAAMAAASRALCHETGFVVAPLAGVVALSPALRIDGGAHEYGGHDSASSTDRLATAGVPLLIMHGLADHVLDTAHASLLFDGSRGPKAAVWLQGAGHQLIERAEDVVATLVAWVPTLFRRYDVVGLLGPQLAPPRECCDGIPFGRQLCM